MKVDLTKARALEAVIFHIQKAAWWTVVGEHVFHMLGDVFQHEVLLPLPPGGKVRGLGTHHAKGQGHGTTLQKIYRRRSWLEQGQRAPWVGVRVLGPHWGDG